jgi:hypothetical protein
LRKSGTLPEAVNASDMVQVTPGDYFEVWVKNDTSGGSSNPTYTYPEDTYFAGYVLT